MNTNSSHYDKLELSLDELANAPSMLSKEELDTVSGGFKWDKNYESPNVIDARGGYLTFGVLTVTFDINGTVSSISAHPA